MKSIFTILVLAISVNGIAQWSVLPNAPEWAQRISAFDNKLYLGHNSGTHVSTNGGDSWSPMGAVDPNASSAYYNIIDAGGTWYLSSSTQGAYRSTDQGATWVKDTAGIGNVEVKDIMYDGSKVHIVTGAWSPLNIFSKTPGPGKWEAPDSIEALSTYNPLFYAVEAYNNTIYATSNSGMYISTDGGKTFLKDPSAPNGPSMGIHKGKFYVGLFLGKNNESIQVFDGSSWAGISTPAPAADQFGSAWDMNVIHSDGSNLYVAQNALLDTSYIYMSADDGATWTSISNSVVKGGLTSMVTLDGELFGVTKSSGTGPNSSKAVKFGETSGGTGIDTPAEDLITVFPNPATDELNIKLANNSATANVHIFNLLGEVVMDQEVQDGSSMNISSLAPGIYFLKVETAGQQTVKRIVKQ